MHPSITLRAFLRYLWPLALLVPGLAAAGDNDRAARKARCEQALAAHEAVLLEYYRAPANADEQFDARLTQREAAVKRHCAGFDIVYRLRVRGKRSEDPQSGRDDSAAQ